MRPHLVRPAARLAGAASLLLVVASATASAQLPASPRTGIVLTVGGGRTPSDPTTSDRESAVVVAGGVRHRPWRFVVAEALVHAQSQLPAARNVVLRCLPPAPGGTTTGCTNRSYTPGFNPSRVHPSALARLGVEQALGGVLRARLTAGGGWQWVVREPFGTAALGLTAGGRRVRLGVDVERWWYGLDATEVTLLYPTNGGPVTSGPERSLRLASQSTWVRIGLEVGVGRRR